MIRILFIIRSLEPGGAERQMIELIKGIDKTRFSITIATFYDVGRLRQEINGLIGVQMLPLHKKSRWDILPFFYPLWQVIHKSNPQIIHGYMGVANVLSLIVGRLSGAKVVWGVRASNMDLSNYDWLSRVIFRLECIFSRFADMIIVNSRTGRDYHLAHGFPAERMVVIPNGIDTERFHHDIDLRKRVRAEWYVTKNEKLIGLVGRLDPMKDHQTFLKAAALLMQERKDVRFVCVGDGPDDYRRELQSFGEELGLDERLIWTGERQDMPAVYNALDIATSSSSFGEGFPNVVGEAMACGVPCVVTDVGDSALIVGDTGVVVPPKSPEKLANGWKIMLERLYDNNSTIKTKTRNRIVSEFNNELLVQRTSDALERLL
ncbi:MAG: glycosyltransferase [Candidatus Methanoperedens sp.]|nr:glycosyltransferase [Candidatus Methanoperedens sp.]